MRAKEMEIPMKTELQKRPLERAKFERGYKQWSVENGKASGKSAAKRIDQDIEGRIGAFCFPMLVGKPGCAFTVR